MGAAAAEKKGPERKRELKFVEKKIGHGHAHGHGHEKLRPLLRKFFGTLIYAKNLQRELLFRARARARVRARFLFLEWS
jgi:hypothetical protein